MASITGALSAASIFVPKPKPSPPSTRLVSNGGRGRLVVRCSSRPKKKATSHHMKRRPKKTQPWDVRRKGPTRYPPLSLIPSDWTLVSSSDSEAPQQSTQLAAEEMEPASAI